MPHGASSQPDFLIDVERVNATLAARQGPRKWRVATFGYPRDASETALRSVVAKAVNAWLDRSAKAGWVLDSKVEFLGPYPHFDIRDGLVDLAKHQWRMRALFKFVKTNSPIRIEVEPGLVRQDRDQTMTLREAMKATGITPGPEE